jgi:hypothetical protein
LVRRESRHFVEPFGDAFPGTVVKFPPAIPECVDTGFDFRPVRFDYFFGETIQQSGGFLVPSIVRELLRLNTFASLSAVTESEGRISVSFF